MCITWLLDASLKKITGQYWTRTGRYWTLQVIFAGLFVNDSFGFIVCGDRRNFVLRLVHAGEFARSSVCDCLSVTSLCTCLLITYWVDFCGVVKLSCRIAVVTPGFCFCSVFKVRVILVVSCFVFSFCILSNLFSHLLILFGI